MENSDSGPRVPRAGFARAAVLHGIEQVQEGRAVARGAGLRTRSGFDEKPRKPRIRWENRGALRVRTGQKTPDRTRNGWQYGWQWAAKRNIHGRVLPSPRWPAVRRQPATIRRDRDEGVHQVPARVAGCFLRHPADCLFGGPALRAAAWCTANVVVRARPGYAAGRRPSWGDSAARGRASDRMLHSRIPRRAPLRRLRLSLGRTA